MDVTEDGNFRYVAFNPAYEQWIGIRSEYLKGKTPEQVFSPTDAVVVRRHYTDCVYCGKTISYEECLRRQGSPSWWLTTLTPQQDSNGRIYRLIGTSTNINKQKQAEAELFQQLGIQIGMTIQHTQLDHQVHCQSADLESKQQIANERAIRKASSLRLMTRKGSAPRKSQARLHQVTQAQARELEKLNSLKNEFLNTLSHELRTPITSISLAAQTLEAVLKQEGIFSQEHPRITQLFAILHCELDREIKLINDLLTLAHLDAQTTPPIMDTINLKTWIPSIVGLFEERIRNSRQHVYILTTGELPLLTTDISDLERILIELLTNACKYTPAGEMIIVSAYGTANMIELSVSNSGVEIASAEQAQIFDAFYRIPNNDPWQHRGTGLGLALVQKLVKRLGASIQVESAAGQTTFTVKFPGGTEKNGDDCSSRERVVFLADTPTKSS
ncbi:hypothetical protein DP117_33935 [Brasilonema sp. UFV-L1]|nr:hypothetical protein [Brasilonema sp. UFV-L1]